MNFSSIMAALTLLNTGFLVFLAFWFNKKLEAEKYKIQRKITDFGLYTTKRHAAYPELYRLILLAEGKVTGLRGLGYSLTFEEYNSEDIRLYLEEKSLPTGKIIEIVKLWDINENELAIKEIRKYEKLRAFQIARNSLSEAQNYLYLNELYMSETVVESARELIKQIWSLFINCETPDKETLKENPLIKDAIEKSLIETKEKMKLELTVSYYDKD
jgi:hypothetical protein